MAASRASTSTAGHAPSARRRGDQPGEVKDAGPAVTEPSSPTGPGLRAAVNPVAALALSTGALLLAACDTDRHESTDVTAVSASAPLFVDRAAETGLVFHHVSGAAGAYHLPEITGAGAALLDYDGDGDLDAYLLQGGRLIPNSDPQSDRVPPPDLPAGNRLFRNELIPGGALRFTDVTESAGVGHEGYAMGVAAGDYDNDGDVDLYITNVGADVLYRNEGNGRFADVTAEAGLGDPRWTTSAAFLDYDGDGLLDLYVAAYVTFEPRRTKVCTDPSNRTDYCAPGRYEPLTDRLYRNDGRGGFADMTEAAGIAAKAGPGLGVLGADFDGDGRLEIFVANDQQANFLWRQDADGRFVDEGLMSGVAYNAEGAAEASMGITAGDFDGDGDDDLFMTHLVTETNTLYVNDGGGRFTDATSRSNLGAPSLRYTGFGAGWLDADADGDLDLFVANGAVAIIDALATDSPYPYAEPDQLFENLGDGRFADASVRASLSRLPSKGSTRTFASRRVSRSSFSHCGPRPTSSSAYASSSGGNRIISTSRSTRFSRSIRPA
jgi:hypothetical protein